MNTKLLMIASAVALALLGLPATFAPAETLSFLQLPINEPLPLIVQLIGALYLSQALANWTAKDNMIGGIYARPLSLANMLHFVMGALALAKYVFAHGLQLSIALLLIVYLLFGICFSYLVFGRGAACKMKATN